MESCNSSFGGGFVYENSFEIQAGIKEKSWNPVIFVWVAAWFKNILFKIQLGLKEQSGNAGIVEFLFWGWLCLICIPFKSTSDLKRNLEILEF